MSQPAKHRIFLSSVQREFAGERALLADRFATDVLLKEHFELTVFERMPAASFSAAENYLGEVKCASFHGTRVEKPIPDHRVIAGDIFTQIDEAVDFVLRKLGTSVGLRDESNQAPVSYEIPRAVIAEAIVNALAHRDYRSPASVQVMLFSDRLEISNPGSLVPQLSVARLKEDHASYPTNLLLAEILYQAGYIERFGTGTGEMYRLCEEAGLAMPEVELDEGFRIRFRRKEVSEGGACSDEGGAS